MATYTTSQMRDAGVQPAALDRAGLPGYFVLEYLLDGSKKAIATNDVVTMWDIPAYTSVIIDSATMYATTASTASCALSVGIAGTDVTGLTAFDPTTAGNKSAKLATAANTVATTGTASSITLKANTAGLGNGVVRIRVTGKVNTAA